METTVATKQQKAPPRQARARGTVQHVYPERGFGFIRCTEGEADDVGQDFFFHMSGLDDVAIGDLMLGARVEFEAREVPRGRRAEHVQLVD